MYPITKFLLSITIIFGIVIGFATLAKYVTKFDTATSKEDVQKAQAAYQAHLREKLGIKK